MKKICHVVDRLNVGGLEKTLIQIVAGLKGYDHHVWCLDENGRLGPAVKAAGVSIREFGFKGGIRMKPLKLFIAEMKKESFDIVHSHGLYPSIWARLGAVAARVPVRIDHVQNLYNQVPLVDAVKLWALSYFTTEIIAVSQAARICLIKNIRVSGSKITVIYNSSPDMRLYALDTRQAVRRELGLGDSFVIGAFGRLEKQKGHEFLIEAVKICRSEGLDVKCVIAGCGPEEAGLREKISGLGLEGTVLLLGLREDVAKILSGIDTLVQPSTLNEGLPLSLAEGASMGLPLIATSIGGNVEIVEDGRNGYIARPRDASSIATGIKELVADPQRSSQMGEASRKIWQERFTVEKMLEEIKKVYEKSQHNNT